MNFKITLGVLSISAILAITGCGSSGGTTPPPTGGNNGTADLAYSTMLSQTSGFLNMTDGSISQTVTNDNGIEVNPANGIFSHDGFVYITGSRADNSIAKYSANADNSFKLEKKITVVESGMSIPTSFIFVDDTKAYVLLAGVGELLVMNLTDFSISKRIDLSDYGMDENLKLHKDGGSDANPEPSGGVIRDGKLFLGLGQINSFNTAAGGFACRGKASVLIIDVASDAIEKHITDDRTCGTGALVPGGDITLAENGDLYINNTASFGFIPGKKPGFLRIKNGETEFDPTYFFVLGDLDLSADFPDLDPALAKTSYSYLDQYKGGKLYVNIAISGLGSNPPDYVNDRNFQPYELDLANKTAIKLNMLPTAGWSSGVGMYKGDVIYSATTTNGTGLYKVGEQTPYITTEGSPVNIAEVKK